jgi:uncharacterized membrane protein YjfL (UPF0719 family)
MQSTNKPFWRSHPIRSAALIGAIIGFANALVVEVGGAIHKNQSAVVLMLWPTDTFAPELSQNGVLRAALILFIEFAGSMLGYAVVFAVPVAVTVAIRRTFRSWKA